MNRARLRQIIKEELSRTLREADVMDPMGMEGEDPDVKLASARGKITSMRSAYKGGELDNFVSFKKQFDKYKQRIDKGQVKDTWSGSLLPAAIADIPTFKDYLFKLQSVYDAAGGDRIELYKLAVRKKLVETGSTGSRITNWIHGFLEGGGDISQMIADAAEWEEATGTWSGGTEEVKPLGYDVEPGTVEYPATRSKYSGRQLDPTTGQPVGQAGEPMKFGRSRIPSLGRFGSVD